MNDSDFERPLEGIGDEALVAMDALMSCWARWDLHEQYYLGVLAAEIAARGVPANANSNEAEAITALRRSVGEARWAQLPALPEIRR